jgi:hypothetical protein
MDRDPARDGWFVVQRLYRPADMRARLRRMAAEDPGSRARELSLPVDDRQFRRRDGCAGPRRGTRLYILSDDNDNPRQRTLLLAFDVETRP